MSRDRVSLPPDEIAENLESLSEMPPGLFTARAEDRTDRQVSA